MKIYSLCLYCGVNVKVDEDGCCATCGCDAIGVGLDDVNKKIGKLRKALFIIAKKSASQPKDWAAAVATVALAET